MRPRLHRTLATSFRRILVDADVNLRSLLGSPSARLQQEYARLRRCGRKEATTTILGPRLRLSHAGSFEGMHREIFGRDSFRFESTSSSPRILDCGANVGLASIYLGQRHPQARITAFEADPAIAALARENLDTFGLQHVELVAAAVSDHDGTVTFSATGDLAGRIGSTRGLQSPKRHEVPAVRLAPYLEEPVDFLKMDIEGAEEAVLVSVADRLHNVQRLFVEYHGFAGEAQRLPEFLTLLSYVGFRYYITTAYDFRRKPFLDIGDHCGMDVQLNIFCTRNASAACSDRGTACG
jgi:FkbM family methyltransferase